MTVRRAAVIGATGVVGGALAEELVRRGVEVVAISRSGGPVAGATAVAAQADDPGALGAAFAGADVVYHLVHSLGADDFAARDRAAAAGVARAAEAAGVAQIVFLGGLGEPGEDGLSEHLASRAETARVLAAGPVPVTTLRAAMIVAPDSAAFVTIVALVDRLPGMICPRWVSTPTQPIARADAVAYLAGVAGVEETFGETYDIGGPEVMTYRGMIERVARAAWPAAADRRGAGAHAAPLLALDPARDAGQRRRRAPARRGHAHPDHRRRSPHRAAGERRADAVRRRRARRHALIRRTAAGEGGRIAACAVAWS